MSMITHRQLEREIEELQCGNEELKESLDNLLDDMESGDFDMIPSRVEKDAIDN